MNLSLVIIMMNNNDDVLYSRPVLKDVIIVTVLHSICCNFEYAIDAVQELLPVSILLGAKSCISSDI